MAIPDPSPRLGRNGRGRADRAHAEIRTQINLPWAKAVQIALNSLKIRFWRSIITASGIFLSIAFLSFSLTTLQLQHPPSDPSKYADYSQAHYRQIWLVVMAGLVCFVGIMNSMLMSVSERFREIGTMKCLGALDSLIVRLFIIEALFMGIIASFGGWLLGFIAIFLIRWGGMGWRTATHTMTPSVILSVFAWSIFVGGGLTLLAALLPARHAAQMPPAAALRTDV